MTTIIRSSSTTGSISPATALLIVGDCKAELWGISLRERLRRSFSTAGITVVVDAEETTTESANIIIVRSDYVLDQRLVDALVGRPNTLLVSDLVDDENGMTPVAIHIAAVHFSQALDLIAQGQFNATNYPLDVDQFSPTELGGNYNIKLRKRAVPYAVSINNKPLSHIEKLTFDASYKGATDFVTKFVWPAPIRLKPGATLFRDWGGQAWRVEVKADGTFGFEGKTWRSLSAIAREITGTSRRSARR